jgi:predicted MPP superfamily phosphohydrolase
MGYETRGYKNTVKLRMNEFLIHFPQLPEELDGLKILFFSDLHLDNNPKLQTLTYDLLKESDYDICICGGDFKASDYPDYRELGDIFKKVFSGLKKDKPSFAVLGNHDDYKTYELLTSYFTFLNNGSAKLKHKGKEFYIVGVDDCHFFHTDDIKKAYRDVSEHLFTIFISHSPEMYKKAEKRGADLFLAGHTHGGQVCLPNGAPITGNTFSSSKIIRGRWRHNNMKGYTTTGVGTSMIPLRLFCPPEICLITLKRGIRTNHCR